MRFWDLFGTDYTKNCLAWLHSPGNPVIPATGDTWKSFWTANPGILEFGGRTLLYYRGNGIMPGTDGLRYDRIGVAEIVGTTRDSIELRPLANDMPIVDIGDPGTFDSIHALDPSAVILDGQVLLYYTAAGDGPDSVGLAKSPDGVHFEKVGKVLTGRAPSAITVDGGVAMLYQLTNEKGRYEFHMACSADGVHFEPMAEGAVLAPTGGDQGWDNFDVSTGRLYHDADGYMLIYGGNSSLIDQPDYFGLARSPDLIHWERHPGNPIFGCGPKGSEDGGAIWFPALIETNTHFILLYEGSRGNYRGDLSSQICMASIEKK